MRHIVIFNAGFLPARTYGGPVVSISNIVQNLNDEFKFTIVTSAFEIDGVTPLIPNVQKNEISNFSKNVQVLYLERKRYTFKNIVKEINNIEEIDLVYVNSFFNFKQLLFSKQLSDKIDVPLLIAPRGELESNALAIKLYKKIPYIKLFNFKIKNTDNIYFQATTIEEKKSIEKNIKISSGKIVVLENLPTLNSNELKDNINKEKNHLNIIFLSRIQVKKNLLYALEVLSGLDNEDIKINFDIFGPIENPEYWEQCKNLIKTLSNNIKVEYKGIIDHTQIFNTFSDYHLFFFPTLSENFGHVIYEALAANRPILISDQTPWTDINNFDAGRAYELEKKEKFAQYILDIAGKDNEQYQNLCRNVNIYLQEKINVKVTLNSYSETFDKIIKSN